MKNNIYVICFYEQAVCEIDYRPCKYTYSTYNYGTFTSGQDCELYKNIYGTKGESFDDPVCDRVFWKKHKIAKQVKKFEYHETDDAIIDSLKIDVDLIEYLAVDYGSGLEIIIDERENEDEQGDDE